jgi:hypothetical protein
MMEYHKSDNNESDNNESEDKSGASTTSGVGFFVRVLLSVSMVHRHCVPTAHTP